MTVSECCLIKLLPYILFQKNVIFIVYHRKWPAQGTSTVPIVSAHFRSLWPISSARLRSKFAGLYLNTLWEGGLACRDWETVLLDVFSYSGLPSVLWRCWLGGRKGIRPVKNWAVGCWRGYLSGARCRLAYGPADATATHCLLLQ